jgi:hypothetical protein
VAGLHHKTCAQALAIALHRFAVPCRKTHFVNNAGEQAGSALASSS